MNAKIKIILGCVVGLVLLCVGSFVALNWDTVSTNVAEALDAQTERTKVTFFRLGELMSIGVAVKDEYGVEPDMAYDVEEGGRILSVSFSDYRLPEDVTAEAHARDIAAFAVGRTKKFEEIDVVKVLFLPETYGFDLDDLMSSRTRPDSPELGDSPRE